MKIVAARNEIRARCAALISPLPSSSWLPIQAAAVIVVQALAPTPTTAQNELRIQRPAPQVFTQPSSTSIAMFEQPVFCPVLLCHGTCSHREGPCLLRTFHNLLTDAQSDCCHDDSNQCGSDQCTTACE